MVKKILIPIKTLGEEGSRGALKSAVSLAAELKPDKKPELIFLHVLNHNGRIPGYAKRKLSELDKEKTEEEFEKIEAICEEQGIENVRTLLKKGKPEKEIPKVAKEENVDLVIIGAGKFGSNEEQRGIGKVVYGKIEKNVTEEVLRKLSRPVLMSPDSNSEINIGLNRLIENEGKLFIED